MSAHDTALLVIDVQQRLVHTAQVAHTVVHDGYHRYSTPLVLGTPVSRER